MGLLNLIRRKAAIRASRALDEGLCPACRTPVAALTPEQCRDVAAWVSPPLAYCPTCRGVVGRGADEPSTTYVFYDKV